MWREIPDGPLILVADAIVKYRNGAWHTWFFMFVRAVKGEDAIILPPYYAPGREVYKEWSNALETIPPDALKSRKSPCERWASWVYEFRIATRLVRTEVSHSSHYGNSGKEEQVGNEPQKKRGEELYASITCVLCRSKQKNAMRARIVLKRSDGSLRQKYSKRSSKVSGPPRMIIEHILTTRTQLANNLKHR